MKADAGADSSSGGDSPKVPTEFGAINYYGGPVLGHFTIYPVYYGQGWKTDAKVRVQAYLAGLAQYLTEVDAPLNQQTVAKQYGIVAASVADGQSFGETVAPATISGASGVRVIIRAAQDGGLAAQYSPNTLVLLLLADGFSVAGHAGGYHGSAAASSFYAAIPDPSGGDMAVLSSEVCNAATDPAGYGPAANAWGAPSNSPADLGGEVADGCIPLNSAATYNWAGVVTVDGQVSPASSSVFLGGRDNANGGACSKSGYVNTLSMNDSVSARGAGRFTGSNAGSGLFRSAAGPSANNGSNIIGSGWVDVLTSTGTTLVYHQWWADRFYGLYGTLVGDLDGDSDADLVALHENSVEVLKSSGSSFGSPETWSFTHFAGEFGTFLVDVDGDARADLVATGPGYVGVVRSTGSGFGPFEQFLGTTVNPRFGNLLADVDGDHCADLVALEADHVDVYRSLGKQCPPAGEQCDTSKDHFAAPQRWFGYIFDGNLGNIVGDVNGDGYDDIVGVADGYIGVLAANGTDAFRYEPWSLEPVVSRAAPILADVNNDGKDDVVLLNDATVTVRLSTPVGRGVHGTHFGPPQIWYAGGF
ncbi:MAG: VCBS repeat-containing protein [Polyangiaceae bacterium]